MTKNEYLDCKVREDAVLAQMDDTNIDARLMEELYSIERAVMDFERKHFHKGYKGFHLDLPDQIWLKIFRKARECRMNTSDYISLLIYEELGMEGDFSWVTDIFDLTPAQTKESTELVSEAVRQRLGWESGDFLRLTSSKDGLSIKKINID